MSSCPLKSCSFLFCFTCLTGNSSLHCYHTIPASVTVGRKKWTLKRVPCLFDHSLSFTILVSLQLNYCIRTILTFRATTSRGSDKVSEATIFSFAHSEDRAKGNAICLITTSDCDLASDFLLCILLLSNCQINQVLLATNTATQKSQIRHSSFSSCSV